MENENMDRFNMDDADEELMSMLQVAVKIKGQEGLVAFVSIAIHGYIENLSEEMQIIVATTGKENNIEKGMELLGKLVNRTNFEFSRLMAMAETVAEKNDVVMPKQQFILKELEKIILKGNTETTLAALAFKVQFESHLEDYVKVLEEREETNKKFDEIVSNLSLNIEEE